MASGKLGWKLLWTWLGDHHDNFATEVLDCGPLIKIKLHHQASIFTLHSVSWGWSPGEKHKLLYQPNTNIDKIELNRISKNRIWSDVDWRYHPIWSSLKRSVIKTYIPVVYWFMFDEHFLVWLDILFIYGSRDIKFLNMKWEKKYPGRQELHNIDLAEFEDQLGRIQWIEYNPT